MNPSFTQAEDFAEDDMHFLAIGDFGTGDIRQEKVAVAMSRYVQRNKLNMDALLLMGDNFYGNMDGGVKSDRWRTGFEEMYPAKDFPGPVWAILGNHDYWDHNGGEKFQLGYSAFQKRTRWTMPSKWYRIDWPTRNPLVTFLFLDSNFSSVAEPLRVGGRTGGRFERGDPRDEEPYGGLSAREAREQLTWLENELERKRALYTIVVGHHPLYTDSFRRDAKPLIDYWGPLFKHYRVPLYLSAHDHDMQHIEFDRDPTSYVINGAGGARPHEIVARPRGLFGLDVHGFTHLQVNRNRLIIRHLDSDRKQLHAFSKTPEGRVKVL